MVDRWIYDKVVALVPTVVIDWRTTPEKCLFFLCGHLTRLNIMISNEVTYREESHWLQGQSVLPLTVYKSIVEAYDTLRVNTFCASLKTIVMVVDTTHYLYFTPGAAVPELLIDEACVCVLDQTLLTIRPIRPVDDAIVMPDLHETNDETAASLSVSLVTRNQFTVRYAGGSSDPGDVSVSRVIVVNFNGQMFTAPLTETAYGRYKKHFGDTRRHYVFTPLALLQRITGATVQQLPHYDVASYYLM